MSKKNLQIHFILNRNLILLVILLTLKILEIMPRNHEADICNPNNDAYQQAIDNHADQLNPNNDEYAGK